ncbi:MAG: saccharopine dehydrogenase C-terminal domain-containing protein [Acetobacter sp.]|uniref:saccharopine dehydrogenase family protein n=1 Tax=Acetobacter sp. TaxID=440 RepID=UPI0039EBA68B
MKKILVTGAGKIGATIAAFLSGTDDYAVTLVDHDQDRLDRADAAGVARHCADLGTEGALDKIMQGQYAVLSAAPYALTTRIATAAAKAGVHYLDLTEDVASTRSVRALAATAGTAFIPQCGLAPGFVSIVAHDIAQKFDRLDTIHLRVGALPEFPSNALGYNLTWSTDGVINEYIEPCEAIVDGHKRLVPALEECETLGVDGVTYEAFNTSGGLGSLCETYDGAVRELNYRTIRYPGHAQIMKILLQDLRLSERRAVLKDIMEHAVPLTDQDMVLIFVSVTGWKNGQLTQESFVRRVYAASVQGQPRTAIQITTAGAICAVLDLLAQGRIPQHGLLRQEDIPLALFLENRFGAFYQGGRTGHLKAA